MNGSHQCAGAPQGTLDSEQQPEFALFLNFLAKDALAHPEQLGDLGDLVAGDEDLFADVEPD